MYISRTLRNTFCAGLLAAASLAQAAPITIPVEGSGQELRVLFDFTGLISEPVSSVNYRYDYSGLNAGETLTITSWGDLESTVFAGETVIEGSDPAGNPNGSIGTTSPLLRDGVFSISFRLNTGTAILNLDRVSAFATGAAPERRVLATIPGVLADDPNQAVPEPATITLAGLALVGLAATRRRAAKSL
jgi:hypothetical protein